MSPSPGSSLSFLPRPLPTASLSLSKLLYYIIDAVRLDPEQLFESAHKTPLKVPSPQRYARALFILCASELFPWFSRTYISSYLNVDRTSYTLPNCSRIISSYFTTLHKATEDLAIESQRRLRASFQNDLNPSQVETLLIRVFGDHYHAAN